MRQNVANSEAEAQELGLDHWMIGSQKHYRRENGSLAVETINEEKSQTQQQFKDDCDVNVIMSKFMKTGEITHIARSTGVYADFTQIKDYQGMLDDVRFAQEAFMTIPAQIRARFENDPGKLLSFLQDERNYDEAVQMGLLDPVKTESRKQKNSPAKNDNKSNDDKQPEKK